MSVHDPSLLIEVVSLGYTGLDPLGLEYAFCGCRNLQNCSLGTANITHITSLKNTWRDCEWLETFPEVNHLVNVETLEYTWYECRSMQTAPNVNTLTKVTTLESTWEDCYNLINPSEVDALIKVTSLYRTWCACESMQTAPNVNTLIGVTDLRYTWAYCSSMTSPSEVSNLTLVTSLYFTWSGCESLLVAPDIGNLSEVTNMGHTFYNCSSLQTVNIPYSINNLTTAWNMLRNSNNVQSMYIDNVLNSVRSSLLANGGEPKGIEMHLGTNNYTAAGLDAFDYLVTTAGWDVRAGELA